MAKMKIFGRKNMPSRIGLYTKLAPHGADAIKRVAELIYSNNDNVALGACRTILERLMPIHRSMSIFTSEDVKRLSEVLDKSEGNL